MQTHIFKNNLTLKTPSNDITRLLTLIAVGAAIGIYLIATAVMITKDGPLYIYFAKQFAVNPNITLKSSLSGYSILIYYAHQILGLFSDGDSNISWALAGQIVSLICRLLAIVPLYFIGKFLVGGKKSFIALFILLLLPYPAKFGSDVLREWPNILFMATAIFLMFYGIKGYKWWAFMLLGLVSGIGYLIRPECLQVVIYAFVWLVIVLLRDKIRANKIKIAYSLMALLFGIAVPMGICTTIKGSKIMPAKLKKVLQTSAVAERTIQDGSAEHPVKEIINGAAKLTNRIGENLMWFFLPAFLLGIGKFYAVKAGKLDIKKSFITFFLAFNVISLLLLYCNYGYISRRHCLPLVVFTIFYIPAGIEITVRLLNEKLLKRLHLRKSGIYAAVLLIGLGICLPKLLKPLHHNKKAYRQASEWLRQNTTSDDVISVPDKRITFYADRKGRSDKGRNFRSDSRYFVKIAKGGNEIIPDEGIIKQAEFNLSKKNAKIIIYSN